MTSQTLADCHSDLPLVNINAPDAADLIRRPAHDVRDLFVGETCLEQFRAERAAQIVNVLGPLCPVVVGMKDASLAANAIECAV